MKIEGKTVCVTGAGGFIGSHLCRSLVDRGTRVLALDDFSIGQKERLVDIEDRLEIVNADIRNPDSLKEPVEKSQVVYALAAIANPRTCQKNFGLVCDVNIMGTANILMHCSDVERVVFLSTIMVYGEPKYLPIDDRHPIDARDPYSISKIMCEYFFKAYHYMNNLPFTIIRNSNTFGPGQDKDYLIPTLILEGLTKGQIEIWDPRVIRDFLYIDNCVEALIKVVESESAVNEIMNLGSGQGIATGELADIVCRYTGATWIDAKKPSPVSSKLISDISKLKALTGWEPKVSLEEGMKRSIEYYKSVI